MTQTGHTIATSAIRMIAVILMLGSIRALGQSPDPNIPAQLKAPEGSKLILRAHAKGDQIYTCKQDGSAYSWILKAPKADLLDQKGRVIGHHFVGPAWQSTDGSKVIGKVAARVDSPDPSSIPWLLLTAAEHSGEGQMSSVSSIQRLSTKGGKAPSTGCDASQSGAETSVPYTADYFFYTGPAAK